MNVPEPKSGDVVSPSQFPGAGFVSGDPLDYDAMNRWAEVYGWSCRFEPGPGGPRIVPAREEAPATRAGAT